MRQWPVVTRVESCDALRNPSANPPRYRLLQPNLQVAIAQDGKKRQPGCFCVPERTWWSVTLPGRLTDAVPSPGAVGQTVEHLSSGCAIRWIRGLGFGEPRFLMKIERYENTTERDLVCRWAFRNPPSSTTRSVRPVETAAGTWGSESNATIPTLVYRSVAGRGRARRILEPSSDSCVAVLRRGAPAGSLSIDSEAYIRRLSAGRCWIMNLQNFAQKMCCLAHTKPDRVSYSNLGFHCLEAWRVPRGGPRWFMARDGVTCVY